MPRAKQYSRWFDGLENQLSNIATETQLAYLNACRGSTIDQAAKLLGVNVRSVTKALDRLYKKAAESGIVENYVPGQGAAPGFAVKGTSTLFGEEGQLLQWVKTDRKREQEWELMREAIEDFAADYEGRAVACRAPCYTRDDLMTVYVWGDPHLGMYAWHEETGNDFNLDIAERHLTEAMERLVGSAPDSETALIINLGDFFHADNLLNRTTRSGHVLDVDTRMSKVYKVGVLTQVQCIDAALQKHKRVKVIQAIGNHDDMSALMLATTMAAWYRNEPRVEIETQSSKFHFHSWGSSLIGVTHGDTVKPEKLGGLMATQKPHEWAGADFRYWYTGHIHSRKVYELDGCMVESFRTLAGKDSWTASMGYSAGRDMTCIVHHRDFGEVERHRVDVAMLSEP